MRTFASLVFFEFVQVGVHVLLVELKIKYIPKESKVRRMIH